MGLFDTLIITKEEKNVQFPKEKVASREKDSNPNSPAVGSDSTGDSSSCHRSRTDLDE